MITAADVFLTAAGVAERCERVGGDFFAAVPPAADAYVLSQVLHDWDDERCIAILAHIRRVIPDHGKLLVVELVLPSGRNEPFAGKWLDLHMLVVTGGRERTAAEYDALLRATGFELTHLIHTPAEQSVVEVVPV